MPLVVGSLVLSIVSLVIGGPEKVDVRSAPRGLFGLMILVTSIVILRAEVSRFHDLGWSGWNVLLGLVAIVDMVVLLFLLLAPGQKAANSYGEPTNFLRRVRDFLKTA